MAVTIKDVAREAEVSISTVSRVINDSKPVSPEVKERVLKAIDELGYIPNELARSLVTKKSNLIGVVVTDIGSSYIAQIVRGIEEVGRMYNYDILLSSSYNDLDRELKFSQILKNKQVEGIIVVSEDYNRETVDLLKGFGRPFIYLNRYNRAEGIFTVSLDHKKAMENMMAYLKKMGHSKIMYLSSEKYGENSIEKIKLEGYKSSVDISDTIVLKLEGYDFDQGYSSGKEIIERAREEDVTAIFASYDEVAIGLLNYCYDHDIAVPDDISIVGYGNIKMASLYRPSLTSVIEPFYDIGAISVRKIIKDIREEESIDESTYLQDRLFIGHSVKKIDL